MGIWQFFSLTGIWQLQTIHWWIAGRLVSMCIFHLFFLVLTSGPCHAAAVLPTISLLVGASFAAFTVARPDDSDGRVNTYILYQEASSRISMVYLDNEAAWSTTQPEALTNADNGTGIACLTMATSPYGVEGEEVLLEEASGTSRCYFQRGGLLREVVLSGNDWIELGTIPLV